MEDYDELPLEAIERPELFIGLIGALGADLPAVTNQLRGDLCSVGYDVEVIKASTLLHKLSRFASLTKQSQRSEERRISRHMDAGNDAREATGRRDFMSLLVISEIRRLRRIRNEDDETFKSSAEPGKVPRQAVAYVIHSLKTPEEVDLLRNVYGRGFYVISAYSSKKNRKEVVAARLKEFDLEGDIDNYDEAADKLIDRDEKEPDSFGQNVRGCFPRADVFVDVSKHEAMEAGISRFVRLLFGHQFVTPTRDEFAMFHAFSAALRSADLARQVGAVITSENGNLISTGCNEVPKAGGGLYWEGDAPDRRDFMYGEDASDSNKREIVLELMERLRRSRWLNKEKAKRGLSTRKIVENLLYGTEKEVLAGSRILSVIEYGRSVHAEMAALMDAARRGAAVQDSTLYCTTFPCHLCARHIIAAGVKRVVYVEPYPKSQASSLYRDSIIVDNESEDDDRVQFEPFVGIAPRFYEFAFRPIKERKNKRGNIQRWNPDQALPKLKRYVPSYIYLEDSVIGGDLPESLEKANITPINRT